MPDMCVNQISSRICCLILLLLTLYACNQTANNVKDQEKQNQNSKSLTESFLLRRGKLITSLELPGELIAYQQVDIYAKTNSFVKKVLVDVGAQVQTGQLLVTLEAPEISSQLQGANSRLSAQEAILKASNSSYHRLFETSKTPGTISKNDLEQALARKSADSAQLMANRSAYKEVKDQLSYLSIHAPFSGVISSRNINPGAFVGPGGKSSELPLFSLEQQDKLRLVISIPEQYTGQLAPKVDVSFSIKALPGKKFHARIVRLAGSLDKKLRAERIEMDVYNQEKLLLPGMYADVTIPVSNAIPTFIVPASALFSSTEGNYVLTVTDHKIHRIAVNRGNENAGFTEVYGKLTDKDTLVLHATDEMHESSTVQTKLIEIKRDTVRVKL